MQVQVTAEVCLLTFNDPPFVPECLGPMVYGIAFCPLDRNKDLKALGVDDSKALTEAQREGLLQKILENNDYIGWAINILSPRHISTR